MPSVPPTYIALDRSSDAILPIVDVLPDRQHTPGSPTPDPDLADGVLVAGDSIGAVTNTSSAVPTVQGTAAPDPHKPHICLSNLSLHSPSSIVGTPFDSSPRFEYPFPAPSDHSEGRIVVPDPLLHTPAVIAPFISAATYAHGKVTLGSLPSYSLNRQERSYSPTHPKHVQKDPPVPPGLAAKKRKSTGPGIRPLMGPRKRSRSVVSEADQEQAQTSPKLARVQAQQPGRRFHSQDESLDTEYGTEDNAEQVRTLMNEVGDDSTTAPSKAAPAASEESSLKTSANSVFHGEYTKCRGDQSTLFTDIPEEAVVRPPTVS